MQLCVRRRRRKKKKKKKKKNRNSKREREQCNDAIGIIATRTAMCPEWIIHRNKDRNIYPKIINKQIRALEIKEDEQIWQKSAK